VRQQVCVSVATVSDHITFSSKTTQDCHCILRVLSSRFVVLQVGEKRAAVSAIIIKKHPRPVITETRIFFNLAARKGVQIPHHSPRLYASVTPALHTPYAVLGNLLTAKWLRASWHSGLACISQLQLTQAICHKAGACSWEGWGRGVGVANKNGRK